jgi:hypothetical protein
MLLLATTYLLIISLLPQRIPSPGPDKPEHKKSISATERTEKKRETIYDSLCGCCDLCGEMLLSGL